MLSQVIWGMQAYSLHGFYNPLGEMIVQIVPAKFLLEICKIGLVVNYQEFQSGHTGIIFKVGACDMSG